MTIGRNREIDRHLNEIQNARRKASLGQTLYLTIHISLPYLPIIYFTKLLYRLCKNI